MTEVSILPPETQRRFQFGWVPEVLFRPRQALARILSLNTGVWLTPMLILTVTTLIGCVRKARLMRETPYWLKPSESYWAYRGQLMRATRSRLSNCLA